MNTHARWLPVVLLLAVACTPRPAVKPLPGAADLLGRARALFEQQQYRRAIPEFQKFIFNYPGSQFAAEAQYYLAESYYRLRDYKQGMVEFQFLLGNFASSPYREEAAFKSALCAFKSAPGPSRDPGETERARVELTTFLEDYPDSRFRSEAEQAIAVIDDRLAEKEFTAAVLYLRFDEVPSALAYAGYLEQNYPKSRWTARAHLELGTYFARHKDRTRALDYLGRVISESEELRPAAARVRQRLEPAR